MSDENEFDEGEESSTGPKALRDQLKKQAKELSELRAERDTLFAKARTGTLAELLGEHKRIAKFYPSDGELSEDAVNAWKQENAEVFGIDTATETDEQTEMSAGLAMVNRTANGSRPTARPAGESKIVRQYSPDEIINLYRSGKSREELVAMGVHKVQ